MIPLLLSMDLERLDSGLDGMNQSLKGRKKTGSGYLQGTEPAAERLT
jgi:hypothetical protein